MRRRCPRRIETKVCDCCEGSGVLGLVTFAEANKIRKISRYGWWPGGHQPRPWKVPR